MAFRFVKFRVYQDAKQLHKEIVVLTNRFSRNYYYLSDQLNRSSLSIVLNIAEGSSKQSDKDFNRYIAISLGSVDETMASLEIAFELRLIKKEELGILNSKLESLSNQLGAFSKSLRSQ